MDNSITFDRFFFQLAQENYEVCYSILSDDSQISRTEDRILRSVIYIDMLYYNFTQASNDDDSCISLMKELLNDLKNSIQIAENPLFYELQTIIDVKISLFLIYKELIGADYSISLDLNRRFEGLLKKLSHLQNYEVMPYKENLVFEITALQNLILGFKSLSTFNYMGTILSLTQAHSSIQQWEKVFILKKFSPTDTSNSKNASNELHKYLQRVLHCVIAKATLYFNLNLSNMHKVELLEFGNEYITR
jgi:KICSTOR complex C12orf66 like